MLPKIVYFLCAATSIGCLTVLLRGYLRTRTRLLLHIALCFLGLALNNLILFVDVGLMPEVNFWGAFWRNLLGAVSGLILVTGLIWELA